MRIVGLCMGVWLAGVVAPSAQAFTTPSDLVDTLYESYFVGVKIDDFAPYLSEDLTRQIAGKIGQSHFALLGFDPLVVDADWAPRHFRSILQSEGGDEAQVEVTFETLNKPVTVRLTLIHEPLHGWQIDHIAGVSGDRTWCTNDIIALSPAE